MAKDNPLKLAAQVAQSLQGASEKATASATKVAPLEPEPAPARVPTRKGKRFLACYVDPICHEEVKQAAMNEGLAVQDLLQQAIDNWMDKHGKDAIELVAARHAKRRSQQAR